MRALVLALPLALAALAAPAPARAGDVDVEAAARRLGEALVLVAATRGPQPALDLAQDLPPRLRDALRAVASSPRADDLRQLAGRLELQAAMVPALVDEVPGLRAAVDAFAADAGARIEREVAAVEREAARVLEAARALEGAAPISRLALAARPGGGELLLLAAQAPLLEADLARAQGAPARYAALAGQFERRPDPLVGSLLVALARAVDAWPRELRALGDRGQVAQAARAADARLVAAAAQVREAAGRAVEAGREARDQELLRVGQQTRGAELEQAVRLYAAYRRQFKEPPALRATRWADVYEDRTSARLHFWLEGEDRWVQGPPRVDPLPPVIDALLAAGDPELRARAVDPGALARVYLLFDQRAGRSRPFAEGLAAVTARAQGAARRWSDLRARGLAVGLEPGALDAALLRRTGLVPALVGADAPPAPSATAADARVARALHDHLLRAAVERGPAAGADLVAALEAAADDLEALRVEAVEVTLEGPAAAIDLVWSPDPDGPEGRAWLVRPVERLPGPGRAGALLVVGAAAGAPRVDVAAHAWTAAGEALAGRAAPTPGAPAALRLAPAHGPGLAVVGPLGPRGLRVVQVPRDAPPLDLVLAHGDLRRPLPPAPGGAWAALLPEERGGDCEVLGLDAAGQVRARLALSLPAARGVRLTSDGPGGAFWARPGSTVEARVVAGGAAVGGRHVFRVEGAGGEVHRREAETLRLPIDLPPGRYRVVVDGAASAPLAVATAPPRVAVAAAPHLPAGVTTLPAGGHAFLRVDAWPALLAEEVRRVEWTVEGGPAPLRAAARPSLSAPGAALVLPLRLAPDARPGARRVVARVETARGALVVEGAFTVGPAARALEVDLRAADGDVLRALPLGGEAAALRARPVPRDATWVVVGPTGRARQLAPRPDGQLSLAFDARDLPGRHEVWVTGTADGAPAAGRLAVVAHAPATLAVEAPAGAVVGRELALDLAPPPGFEPPVRARVEGGPWSAAGARARVGVVPRADNDLALVLEDAAGRRARGRLRFAAAAQAPADPVSKERYGVAVNVTQRRLFAAGYELLQAYRRNDNLPRDWVVVEPGPLTAARARDRMWALAPYDGPAGDAQVAYRSRRCWGALPEPARRGLAALGLREGDVLDVQDSPAPAGEETLRALVARHLAEHGAWEFRLVRVRAVRADGAVADRAAPRDPQDELRLFKVTASGEGAAVDRVEAPGPLGDLRLRPVLPATITLGRAARMSFTVLASRAELVAGRRYPGGLEALLPRALLCPELTVEVDVEGRRLAAEARRAGRAVAGVDVGVRLEHVETARAAEVAGAPRRAEVYRVVAEPFTQAAAPVADVRFDPIPPGLLDNAPRTLVVTVRARLVPAVPLAAWPADRPRPEPVTIEGAPFVLVRDGLPDVAIELQATYQRQAPDGPKPWPAVLPPVEAVRSGGEAAPRPVEAPRDLGGALAALERGALDEAEEAARRAVYARPEDPAAWALLADVLLRRRRPLEALGRARWSLLLAGDTGAGAGGDARARVVEAEAAWADGRLDEARAAADAAGDAAGDARLRGRLERLRGQMGR